MSAPAAIILIVDDELRNRKLLELLLHAEGYRTICAANGADALGSVARQPPDLILLDLMMPEMNGHEVAARLKADPGTSNIPIIMVTAKIDRDARLAGLGAGVEEFLTKPVDRTELSIRVRNLLRLKALGDLLRDHNSMLEKQVQARTADLQRFRTAMDATSDAIFLIDCSTLRFLEFNAAACTLLGYSREELFQAGPARIAEVPETALGGIYESLIGRPGRNDPSETRLLRGDGGRLQVEVNRQPQRHGDHWILVETVRDITERKRFEETLREATRTAEQANRAKSEFLANMSHEIRTPMNAVVGLAYLMGQTSLDERQTDILAKTKLAGRELLGLLNNILDLSKIEAGELIVENTVFDLPDLLARVADLAAVAAQAKAIAFAIDVPHELPALLAGDATRLAQILTNLLSNAVKFTEHGGVTLRVRRCAVTAAPVTLCFTVQDTGIGIPAALQQTVFSPFVQGDSSVTRRFGGSGLGLSIVKRLAALLGGTVELQSTPGVGSEFTVMLSFAPAAATAAGAAAAAARDTPDAPAAMHGAPTVPDPRGRALRDVRVLIVDDSDINREVARRVLELAGAHVELAADGLQAVETIRSRPREFDVVLMDIQMPVLDGHEATRRIRGELRLPHLPIIAFTAAALDSHRLQAVEAGMNDYLVKPFEPQTLIDTILNQVKRPALQLQRQRDGAAPAFRAARA
jgi:PAS domain S-box-containing protein